MLSSKNTVSRFLNSWEFGFGKKQKRVPANHVPTKTHRPRERVVQGDSKVCEAETREQAGQGLSELPQSSVTVACSLFCTCVYFSAPMSSDCTNYPICVRTQVVGRRNARDEPFVKVMPETLMLW
jgi:hypothetical protein